LHWHLDQPFRLKHLVIAVLILALLLVTGHRTEMDRMVTMTTQAVGNLVGLNDESQVVRGLSKVADSMWPPQMATSEEIARMNDFNVEELPSAHPETPIFSQFSLSPKMGTELSAFKKMKAANYWSVWLLSERLTQIPTTGVRRMALPRVLFTAFQSEPVS
jgi:hypothetical protein